MASPNRTPEDDLRRDIIIELTNAYYETYKNERPNDTYEQLGAFCRDLAENDVEELLAANCKAQATALLEKGPEDMTQAIHDKDKFPRLHWRARGFNNANKQWRSIIKEQGGK